MCLPSAIRINRTIMSSKHKRSSNSDKRWYKQERRTGQLNRISTVFLPLKSQKRNEESRCDSSSLVTIQSSLVTTDNEEAEFNHDANVTIKGGLVRWKPLGLTVSFVRWFHRLNYVSPPLSTIENIDNIIPKITDTEWLSITNEILKPLNIVHRIDDINVLCLSSCTYYLDTCTKRAIDVKMLTNKKCRKEFVRACERLNINDKCENAIKHDDQHSRVCNRNCSTSERCCCYDDTSLAKIVDTEHYSRLRARDLMRFEDLRKIIRNLICSIVDVSAANDVEIIFHDLSRTFLASLYQSSYLAYVSFDDYANVLKNTVETVRTLRVSGPTEIWLYDRIVEEYCRAEYYRLYEYVRTFELWTNIIGERCSSSNSKRENDESPVIPLEFDIIEDARVCEVRQIVRSLLTLDESYVTDTNISIETVLQRCHDITELFVSLRATKWKTLPEANQLADEFHGKIRDWRVGDNWNVTSREIALLSTTGSENFVPTDPPWNLLLHEDDRNEDRNGEERFDETEYFALYFWNDMKHGEISYTRVMRSMYRQLRTRLSACIIRDKSNDRGMSGIDDRAGSIENIREKLSYVQRIVHELEKMSESKRENIIAETTIFDALLRYRELERLLCNCSSFEEQSLTIPQISEYVNLLYDALLRLQSELRI